jgi:hypothetical protein
MHDELKKRLDQLEIPTPSSNLEQRILDAAVKNAANRKPRKIIFHPGIFFKAAIIPLAGIAALLVAFSADNNVHNKNGLHILADISFLEDFEDEFFEDDFFLY